MKIELIGTGCTWTKRLSTSFIINDHIMLDCPQGSFKTMFNSGKLDKIDTVIISHYHSDHWADLHLFVEILKNRKVTRSTKIYAPEGFWKYFENVCNAFQLPKTLAYAQTHLSFNKLTNGKVFKSGNLNITAYTVKHIPDSFGFAISEGQKTIGFSCDTAMCENLVKIIKKSKAIFIDMAAIYPSDKHLSVNDVINLKKEFENVDFYPIHLSKFSIAAAKNKMRLPKDGDVFNF